MWALLRVILPWRKSHASVFMGDYSYPITVADPSSIYPAEGNKQCICMQQSYFPIYQLLSECIGRHTTTPRKNSVFAWFRQVTQNAMKRCWKAVGICVTDTHTINRVLKAVAECPKMYIWISFCLHLSLFTPVLGAAAQHKLHIVLISLLAAVEEGQPVSISGDLWSTPGE